MFVADESENKSRANHGHREHRGEWHVCGCGMRKAGHADGGGQEKHEPSGRFDAGEAPDKPCKGESREQGRDGTWKAGGGFADTKKLETQRGTPIIKRRFFEPGLTVEARRDPVARFHHVARDPGVARLIGTDQADGTEVMEVAEVQSGEDQGNPSEARGERR